MPVDTTQTLDHETLSVLDLSELSAEELNEMLSQVNMSISDELNIESGLTKRLESEQLDLDQLNFNLKKKKDNIASLKNTCDLIEFNFISLRKMKPADALIFQRESLQKEEISLMEALEDTQLHVQHIEKLKDKNVKDQKLILKTRHSQKR